jgi:hypothetical protein
MDELLTQNAETYARRNHLRLAERLGHGIHGIVYAAERNAEPGNVAIKVHRSRDAFERERDVYLRLREAEVHKILGFSLPRLIRCDDELLAIEMSIVSRPFLLDFAGAYLDHKPHFSDEIWSEWEIEKLEQFESRWPEVQAVPGRVGRTGHLHGGCFAQQHCVPQMMNAMFAEIIGWLHLVDDSFLESSFFGRTTFSPDHCS